jgi:hypothetical protein
MRTQDEELKCAQAQVATGQYGLNQCNQVRPASNLEVQNARIERAARRLDYHPPTEAQKVRYQALRDAAKAFVTVIIRNCPEYSQDVDNAVSIVEAALMQANKSIANEGL